MSIMATPLVVCYANCSRSVLAYYLFRHLGADAPARFAGLMVGIASATGLSGC
jgi:protein-tyrosine-phosphatase